MSKSKKLIWLPLIIWGLAISYLSFSTSAVKVVPEFRAADKVAHFIMYALLELFIYLPLKKNKRAFNVLTFFAITFAGLTELIQHYFVIGRTGDIYDFIANLFGLMFVYYVLRSKIKT